MEPRKRTSKNIIWTMISLLLAILTVRVILKQNRDMSFSDLTDIIRSSNKIFVILSMLSAVLYVWFESIAIWGILKKAGYKRSPLKCLLYSTSDVYFSAITPSASGGQPASAYFMRKDGIPGGTITATLVLNLIMYTVSVVFLGLISILIRPGTFASFGTSSRAFITFGFFGLTVLTVGFFILLKNGSLIFNPLTRLIDFAYRKKIIKNKEAALARLEKVGNDYHTCSGLISNSKRILIYAFAWNLLQRINQLIVPSYIYAALGGNRSDMVTVFAKQCLVTIGYNCIPIPGGMGISDFLMIDGFTPVMGESMAYSVELISRGITFYICVAISGLITLAAYIWRKHKDDDRSL